MPARRLPLLVAAVTACAGPTDGAPPPTDDPSGHSAALHSAAPTGETAQEPPVVRCGALVEPPLAPTLVNGRAQHDLVFDGADRLVGATLDGGLWRYPRKGAGELWSPGRGVLHQLAWLPDGGLAIAVGDLATLERVDPGGGRSVIASGVGAYAVRLGPDGWLWTANGEILRRVDPATGAVLDLWPEALPAGRPKVLAFDRERTTLFVGTVEGAGALVRFAIDAGHRLVGPPVPVASAGGGWHDALELDACGNLYVTDALTRAWYRVAPDGVVTELGALGTGHAHGLAFGSGSGGWRADALYLAQPYAGASVSEVIVGVPGVDFNGGRYTVEPSR